MKNVHRKAKRRTWLIAPFAALLVGVTGTVLSLGGGSLAAITTPTCPATSLTKTGAQTSQIKQANSGGTWNLTGATWTNTTLGQAIVADPATNSCILGGHVDGDIDKTVTRDAWFDGDGGTKRDIDDGIVFTQTNTANNFSLYRNNYIEDYEDAYDFQSTATANTGRVYLDHVQANYIRDDCIENEGSSSDGTPPVQHVFVKNSLFDGCFTGIAWRPSGSDSGDGTNTTATFEMEDSLMHVSQQPLGTSSGKYCTSSRIDSGRCESAPTSVSDSGLVGLYGIWKWSDVAPAHVTIRNTIFKLDGQSYSSCTPWDWPDGTYDNVKLVWSGSSDYNDLCDDTLPAGVTMTTDESVWNNAKAAWLNGATPTPSPTPTPTPTVTPTPTETPTPHANPTIMRENNSCGEVLFSYYTDDEDTMDSTFEFLVDGEVMFSDTLTPVDTAQEYLLTVPEDSSGGSADVVAKANGAEQLSFALNTDCEAPTPTPTPTPTETPTEPAPTPAANLVCPVVVAPEVGDTVLCTYQ